MGIIVYMAICITLLFVALSILQLIENIFNYIESEIKKAKRRKIVRANIKTMRMQRAKFYSLVID